MPRRKKVGGARGFRPPHFLYPIVRYRTNCAGPVKLENGKILDQNSHQFFFQKSVDILINLCYTNNVERGTAPQELSRTESD